MMLKQYVLDQYVQLMYTVHLSVRPFRKAEPRKKNVYDGEAAQEYERTLPKKDNTSALQRNDIKRKIVMHLHFSDITAVQFCVLSI